MNFLFAPIPGFKKIAQRPNLTDAGLVVISVAVVFLGYRTAQLASVELLTLANFVRAFFDVVVGISVAWFAIAGVALLLGEAAGGTIRLREQGYEKALALTGIAAVPIVFAGIIAMLTALLLNSFLPACGGQHWIVLAILWLGVVLGTPGVYFALALEYGLKIPRKAAAGITLIVFAATLIVVTLQYYVFA